MTTAPPQQSGPRTYGNFQSPRRAGLFGGLGYFPSLVLGGGLFLAAFVTFIAGMVPGAFIACITVLGVAVTSFPDQHGDSIGTRIARRWAHWRGKRRGEHLYRSGPLSMAERGEHTLPGLAAQTKLVEARDSWNRPFALLEVPSTNDYTVVYTGDPEGSSLVDQDTIDAYVSNYGGWLAGCASQPDVVGMSVVIEAREDTGARVRAEVNANGGKGSDVSRRVMQATATELPQGSSVIRAYATTTHTASPSFAEKRRTTAEMALDLATRVPMISEHLRSTGLASARPATANDVCEAVRCAFDPELVHVFDQARAQGVPLDLSWADVGPTAHDDEFDHYRHGPISVTWYMSLPPKGAVPSGVLGRLMAPHPAVDVKRVALLYRPFGLGAATKVVNDDVTNAEYRVNNPRKGTATASDKTALRKAEKTAEEESSGAGVTNFAVVITGTVLDVKQLREARSVIAGLAINARLVTRVAHASQASAFLFGLPLGLIPSHHVSVPETVRKGM